VALLDRMCELVGDEPVPFGLTRPVFTGGEGDVAAQRDGAGAEPRGGGLLAMEADITEGLPEIGFETAAILVGKGFTRGWTDQ